MFETRGLLKLGIFSGDDLALSLCWGSLAEKLAVSIRINFVADLSIDTKWEMRPNTLGIPFPFLSIS